MRRFFAMITAILKSMGHFTTEFVREGGKWVAKLLRVPGAPMHSMPTETDDEPASVPETFDGVRRAAGALAMGKIPTPEDLVGVSEKAARWLQVQPKDALHRIMCADDEQLREHVRGRSPIRGVVPFDDAAIADMEMAEAAEEAMVSEPTPVMRTRRMALQERGMRP